MFRCEAQIFIEIVGKCIELNLDGTIYLKHKKFIYHSTELKKFWLAHILDKLIFQSVLWPRSQNSLK